MKHGIRIRGAGAALALAAALLLVIAPGLEAQDSSLRITITGGPHAGTYELAHGQCDALHGSIISMFTPVFASVSKTFAATPEWLRMPTPISSCSRSTALHWFPGAISSGSCATVSSNSSYHAR